MSEEKKKSRAPNYSPSERELLIRIVATYKDILENKKNNSITTEEKNKAWKRNCQCVQCTISCIHETISRLFKAIFQKLKRNSAEKGRK